MRADAPNAWCPSMSEAIDRSTWAFEQVIEHACSLAIGYGSGRTDLLEEYKETKERALRMARQSRVRVPTSEDDSELTAAGGDHAIADLLNRWETDQGEWFGSPTLEIVAEYAAWREARANLWQNKPQDDLEVAIAEFKAKLPGWWYSVCECQVSCDASCAPTTESSHIDLIQTDEKGLVLRRDDPFDSGFHADLPQPSSLAEALRDVMNQALTEIENRKGIANV